MSLRARLAVAAGVAVALAVLAVTITAYAGTKSELRGQLDSTLSSLADRLASPGRNQAGPGSPGISSSGVGSRGVGSTGVGSSAGGPGSPRQPFAFGGGPPLGGEPPGIGDEGLAQARAAAESAPAGAIARRDGVRLLPPIPNRTAAVPANAARPPQVPC